MAPSMGNCPKYDATSIESIGNSAVTEFAKPFLVCILTANLIFPYNVLIYDKYLCEGIIVLGDYESSILMEDLLQKINKTLQKS